MARRRKASAPIDSSLLESLALVNDPRSHVGLCHPLKSILTLSICGVLCGADNWVAIQDWANAKKDWLEGFLDLPNGIPSHDTLGRVFAVIDPEEFQQAFIKWTASLSKSLKGQVIAVDGKTLRRSFDRANESASIHMVSAWCTAQGLSLGQEKTEAKSNEITAIPSLLKKLKLAGAIVTIDAMGCQKKITAAIREQNADYVIAVKDNQPKLHEGIKTWFEEGIELDREVSKMRVASTEEHGHGREEERAIWIGPAPADLVPEGAWAGLQSVACVERLRIAGGKQSIQYSYYISSLPPDDPGRVLEIVRQHWGIENSLHWVLDMAFREDEARVRINNAAENMSRLRQMALNLIKIEPDRKVGVKTARMRAGWDNNYLIKILGASG